MRKFISIIFISLFCSNVALAAITCTPSATDNCEAGCYYTDSTGCAICEDGTYTDTAGSSSCSICNRPKGANFTSPGTSIDDCSWKLNCPAGKHYVSDTTNSGCQPCPDDTFTNEDQEITGKGYETTQACRQCGANSTTNSNRTNCNCKDGYHFTDSEGKEQTQNTDGKDCQPNKYTITYESNNEKNQKQTQQATYNSPIKLLDKKTFEKKGYQIEYWQHNAANYVPGDTFLYDKTENITFKAIWSGNEFTITYIDTSCNDPQQQQTCSYASPMGCLAPSPTCTPKGHHFLGWECTSGCTTSEPIKKGTDISTISGGENMTLTAVWEKCPIGHYCEKETKNKCPAGSTSDAGSSTKADCYIQGGTTQICDKVNRCFTLPASAGNIYYHGSNNSI